MGSSRGDLTAKAVIRNEALRLFADRGPDAVPIREIAAAAGVSPALVVHHFGSKAGLRQAIDEHVAQLLQDLMHDIGASGPTPDTVATSFSELLGHHLPPGSPVPAYLRRLLLAGDRVGLELVRDWHASALGLLTLLTEAGVFSPSPDPEARAAFLLSSDLAVLLLRDQLAAVLAVDPLSPEGLTRWAEEVVRIYRDGLFTRKDES